MIPTPMIIYCDASCDQPMTAHDWLVSGAWLVGIFAVMALLFWLAERYL